MQKNKQVEKLYRSYHNLLTALKNHNVEASENAIQYLEEQESEFWSSVAEVIGNGKDEIETVKQNYNDNQSYAQELSDYLLTKNIPLDLRENTILIGPMVIDINVEQYHILISVGRKKKKIGDLEINRVAKIVEQFYKRINGSFNVNSFGNRLVKAYEFLNKSMYSSRTVQYGNAVPLEDIFKMFTLSPLSNDYKIENFLWDLGRLTSNLQNYTKYQLEFGFSRNIGRMYIIKDIEGNTHKYSTLTVYKNAE